MLKAVLAYRHRRLAGHHHRCQNASLNDSCHGGVNAWILAGATWYRRSELGRDLPNRWVWVTLEQNTTRLKTTTHASRRVQLGEISVWSSFSSHIVVPLPSTFWSHIRCSLLDRRFRRSATGKLSGDILIGEADCKWSIPESSVRMRSTIAARILLHCGRVQCAHGDLGRI